MEERVQRDATIKDVARLAGCGIATVSRVLNQSGPVSEESRRRVMAAAHELGFQFSDLGRSLRSSVTRTIGCVVPSISNPVYGAAVQGLQEVATLNGYQLLLSCTGYDLEEEVAAVRMLIGKRVDALVLTMGDTRETRALDLIRARKLPHCLLFNHRPETPNPCAVDNRRAGQEVGRALAAAGHRHLGYVGLRLSRSDRARQRLEGLRAACKEAALPPPALLEIEEQSRDLDHLLAAFLTANPSITGIFASNDLVAIALIAALRRFGLSVPGDLSVVGFDGIEFGQMMEPALATIATDPMAMGRASADTVLSNISNTAQDAAATHAAAFVFRTGGSLGAPADGKALAKKLHLLRQLSLPREKSETSRQER